MKLNLLHETKRNDFSVHHAEKVWSTNPNYVQNKPYERRKRLHLPFGKRSYLNIDHRRPGKGHQIRVVSFDMGNVNMSVEEMVTILWKGGWNIALKRPVNEFSILQGDDYEYAKKYDVYADNPDDKIIKFHSKDELLAFLTH